MSYPTVLSPWYVVQTLTREGGVHDVGEREVYMEYYAAEEDGSTVFQQDKRRAMLFMSLRSAARSVREGIDEIRVLTTEAEAKEFGRA